MSKIPRIYIYIAIVIVVLLITFWIFKPNNSTKSVTELLNRNNSTTISPSQNNTSNPDNQKYNCLFSADEKIEKYSDYIFELVVSDQKSLEWEEHWQDNGIRSINLSDVKNNTSSNKIYYSMYRSNGSTIDKSITMTFQVCSETNTTQSFTYYSDKKINPISRDPGEGLSTSSYSELPYFAFPDVSGKYRVDGLAYYNDEWHLVDRMTDLQMK